MKDILQTISQFVQYQFPAFYRDGVGTEITQSDRAVLVDFVEAYYEWLEQTVDDNALRSRKMFEYRDIDETLPEFVDYFKKKYLDNLPYIYSTDDRFVVKHIIDMYRAKGSESALKLLIRLVFNQDISIYYPAEDILRPSHSIWKEPKYIELTSSKRTKGFIGKKITGSVSGASAYVESLVTKRVNGKFIDIIYIVDIKGGDFITGEYITDDGVLLGAPKMNGSLTTISVNRGGSGYSIGDRLSVRSVDGKNGVARVTEVLSQSDVVEFELLDSGYGYSLTDTGVYVSTAVLFCNNAGLDFDIYETVTQALERVTTNTAITGAIGDTVIGYDSSLNPVANGIIVFAGTGANNFLIETKSGSFEKQYTIQLQDTNRFAPGEVVEEENNVELEVTSLTAPFTPGEQILQRKLENGVYRNVAIGKLISYALDTFTVENAFGTFISGLQVEGLSSGSFANIVSVSVTSTGSTAEILTSNSSSITVRPLDNEFTANNQLRGIVSKNINTIVSIADDGINSIEINGNTAIVSTYANESASGFVLGQDTGRVGLYGNTNPFYFVNGVTNEITGNFGTKEITRIGKGSGATFELGTLNADTIETANIVSDLIGGENTLEVPYLDLLIDGTNSGVTRLNANVNIIDGGSGYTNGTSISFNNGGYDGGEPLIEARAEIITDANGAIIDVNVSDPGQGYNDVPSYSISGGAGANVEFTIEVGYGFDKAPILGLDDIINDVLGERSVTIGEIATIKNINQGSGYDTGVFVRVINEEIQDFNIKDVILKYANNVGTFANGEVIVGTGGAKGRIRSIDLITNELDIKYVSLFDRFSIGETITGETSNTTAKIITSADQNDNLSMAENAEFGSYINLSDGVIANVAILDSGYGYRNGTTVELYNANNELATTGSVILEKQGKGLGFWKSQSSHIGEKYIRDNDYYQEFSYEIVSPISFDRYEDIVKDVLHIAGTKLFGRVELQSFINNDYTLSSSIVRGENVVATGEFIGDFNVANTPFTLVGVDGSNSGVGRLQAAVIINDGGIGYSNGVVTFIGGGLGNTEPTSPAEAVIITDDFGTLVDFQINEPGAGYYQVPDFTLPGGGSGANVAIAVELGYGFLRDPFADINSVIGDTLGSGQILFVPTEVVYDE